MLSPSGIYLRKNAKRKYDAVLKAACRLFLKNGYTRTSMDAVAVAAGVSKQTVYSYFTNKDILFCQMIEAECERHAPPESMLESPSLRPEDALFRIGRGYQETILSHRGLAINRLVTAEAERHPRIAKLFFESGPLKMRRMLIKYLDQPMAREEFNIQDSEKAAKFFLDLVKAGYHFRMLLRLKPVPNKKEMDEHVRDTIQAFYKIYGKRHHDRQSA